MRGGHGGALSSVKRRADGTRPSQHGVHSEWLSLQSPPRDTPESGCGRRGRQRADSKGQVSVFVALEEDSLCSAMVQSPSDLHHCFHTLFKAMMTPGQPLAPRTRTQVMLCWEPFWPGWLRLLLQPPRAVHTSYLPPALHSVLCICPSMPLPTRVPRSHSRDHR